MVDRNDRAVSHARSEFTWNDRIHGVATSPDVHLPHNPMNVIAHGKLREIHVRRNFLIGQALRHQFNQLALAERDSMSRRG